MKRNKINFLILIMFTLVIFSLSSNVYAVSYKDGFDLCKQSSALRVFQLIGILIEIVKILVPVLIIIIGTVELAKAVMAGDDKASKQATTSLVKRFAAGIIIFFVPVLVDVILGFISDYSETVNKFKDCKNCLFNPNDASCNSNIKSGEDYDETIYKE